MNKRYQGGSLVGFIVVGVLLALVLIGGLYGLNRYNAQKAAETAAQEQTDKNGSTDVATNTDKKDATKTEKPADTSSTTEPAATGTTDPTQVGGTTATTGTAAQNSGNLPHTGPADTAAQLFAVVALTFAGTSYLRSRSRI